MALENLTPVIRPEKILNGEAIEPVTRKEYFMQKGASGGGAGGGGVFPVELLYDEALDSLRSSKTSTEIISAFQSGLLPYLFFDDSGTITIYAFTGIESNSAIFSLTYTTVNNSAIVAIDSETYTVQGTLVLASSGHKTF